MLNHIVIMGRLTHDPELRRAGPDSIPVASFRVAVDRDYSGKDQEKETDFIDCVAWRHTGEFVSKYFTKGSMIVVSGRLQIRGWTDKDGNKRRSAEVNADNCYFGESKGRSEGRQTAQGGGYGGNSYGQQSGGFGGYMPPSHGYQSVEDEYNAVFGDAHLDF